MNKEMNKDLIKYFSLDLKDFDKNGKIKFIKKWGFSPGYAIYLLNTNRLKNE